jgi:hypothetical protein
MLNLLNLNEHVRQLMLEEVDRDMERGTLYVSPRLSNTGVHNYATLLKEAMRAHDDDWLAQQLSGRGRVQPAEPRRKRQGGFSLVKGPTTPPAPSPRRSSTAFTFGPSAAWPWKKASPRWWSTGPASPASRGRSRRR